MDPGGGRMFKICDQLPSGDARPDDVNFKHLTARSSLKSKSTDRVYLPTDVGNKP